MTNEFIERFAGIRDTTTPSDISEDKELLPPQPDYRRDGLNLPMAAIVVALSLLTSPIWFPFLLRLLAKV